MENYQSHIPTLLEILMCHIKTQKKKKKKLYRMYKKRSIDTILD